MGFGYFYSICVLSLFFIPSLSQQPNTDEYFISAFLHKMGFNLSTSVCSWKGIQCDISKIYVLGINLSNLGLSGLIPDNSIGKLSKLQILDLSNNKITDLPSDFWSLGSLKTLNLSSNQFSGYLPSNIGNFGQLQALDLSNNNFSGNIPEAVSSLTSLKILKLSQNGFESSIPSGLTSCPSLISIDLSSNHLRGSLPKGFFAALPNLESFNIAVNKIHGQESDFLGMSSMISYLNLSRNQFQVKLNHTFNWSNLVYLDLSENQFGGGGILSGKFINEAKKLKQLNLAFNRFESRGFPKITMLLPGLEYLNLSGLNLTGHIPSEISKMIKILDLSFNNLSGIVPLKILDRLLLMERFNFSYNNLTLCDSEFSTEILHSGFIGSTNSCPIAANPELMRRKSHLNKGFTLALILVICLLVALLFLAFGYGYCYGYKRKNNNTWTVKKQESYKEEMTISGPFTFQTDSTTWVADVKLATSVPVVIFEKPLLNFTFADLLSATSNFERGTLLAEGRFGPVYRGFLPGGIHVTVKVLVNGSTMAEEEFEYLGRIKHPNLVPLMGYCIAGNQRIAIYEYMENGNLQNLLHDLPLGVLQTNEDNWDEDESEGLLTNWRFRHKIALGTARALAFLHHGCSPPIIHGDVKASSVYLDSSLESRLSDFGLSKIFVNGIQTDSDKSDVYGFGVILFELMSGKKGMGDEEGDLVRWVRGLVKRNEGLIMAIDPKIQGTGIDEHMEEVLKVGYLCTADLPSKRPSMQQVVGLLKDIDPLKNHP